MLQIKQKSLTHSLITTPATPLTFFYVSKFGELFNSVVSGNTMAENLSTVL
jgi:hypothetical protein